METAQRQHPPPGELLGLAQPLQLSGRGARDAPPATAELTFQAWPPQLPERERARQHVGGDCARDRGRVGGRWAPAPPHRPAHSQRFVTPGRAHVPQLRLGAIPRGTHPPCAEDTGLDGKALPEGRPVCVQLAPLPRAGSRPPTSYSGWGGGGGSVCDTQHSWLPGHATQPSQRLRAGLECVAVGEQERTHTLDSGTSGHTRAGKSVPRQQPGERPEQMACVSGTARASCPLSADAG